MVVQQAHGPAVAVHMNVSDLRPVATRTVFMQCAAGTTATDAFHPLDRCCLRFALRIYSRFYNKTECLI